MKYEVGDKIGNLEILKITKKKFFCRCILCSKEKEVWLSNIPKLKLGCSCVPRPRRSLTTKDLTGEVFGLLTVMKMAQNLEKSKKGIYYAVCSCACGKEHWVAPACLRYGDTKSCGCDKSRYAKISGKNSVQFTGYEGLSGSYIGKLKNRAKSDNYEFNLTAKFLWTLFLAQNRKCALSGIDIHITEVTWKKGFGTASIDRIDSNKGYTEDNVQWVHKDVNRMKMDFKVDYFVDLCRHVANVKD